MPKHTSTSLHIASAATVTTTLSPWYDGVWQHVTITVIIIFNLYHFVVFATICTAAVVATDGSIKSIIFMLEQLLPPAASFRSCVWHFNSIHCHLHEYTVYVSRAPRSICVYRPFFMITSDRTQQCWNVLITRYLRKFAHSFWISLFNCSLFFFLAISETVHFIYVCISDCMSRANIQHFVCRSYIRCSCSYTQKCR